MTLRQKFHSVAKYAQKIALGAVLVPASVFGFNLIRGAYAEIAEHKPHEYQQYKQWGYSDKAASETIRSMNSHNLSMLAQSRSADEMLDLTVVPMAAATGVFLLTTLAVGASRPREPKGKTRITF